MTTYAEKLRNPKWQRKRLSIMKRDKFKCKKCGDEETMLNVHHKIYKKGADPWDYDNTELVTICEHCHVEIEDLKKENDGIVEFDNIKIYKSDNWQNGNRIMFVSYDEVCSMAIYTEKDEHVIGFNFMSPSITQIIKILKKAL